MFSSVYKLLMMAREPVIRRWYDQMSRIDRDADMTLMNYGWASLDPSHEPVRLEEADEVNRYSIQLYHQVAGAVDLRGSDVLEVGSGRGGGASFIARYLEPRSMTGLDFSPKAIAFCNNHYSFPTLSFQHGNAERLPFQPSSFDAVVNIESSHCYGSIPGFLREVHRVLRPGGHLLYSDYCQESQLDALRHQMSQTGFSINSETDISANVLKALQIDDGRKRELINRKVPPLLKGFFYEFAGLQGTRSYNSALRRGEKVYFRFILEK
ncbi:MAG: class I SAM-dependent methyltransferase [Candidatus Fermentibacteraceae bacterium]